MNKKILFTACDAGTINYLLPVLRELDGTSYDLYAHGSASVILKKEGLPFKEISTPLSWDTIDFAADKEIGNSNYFKIITGTSWGPTIDKSVTLFAKRNSIPSFAIVDHWDIYAERFSKIENGTVEQRLKYLPDFVLLNDEIAVSGAINASLPEKKLINMGQPFLESQFLKFQFDPTLIGKNIFFISEIISQDFSKGSESFRGYTEFDVLSLLIDTIDFSDFHLIIKLHPNEKEDKYDEFLKKKFPTIKVKVCKNYHFQEMITTAFKIVGMGSMLLLEAALHRDDVISVLPGADQNIFIGNKIRCTHYFQDKEHLKKLLKVAPTKSIESFGTKFLGSKKRFLEKILEI